MRIRESVEILAPREKVFSLLLDVEKRMRLNPAWDYVDVRRLTEETGVGAKYRIRVKPAERVIEYVTEWMEVKRNRRIVYRTIEGPSFSVTQTLKETFRGTGLTQTEDLQVEQQLGEHELRLAKQLLKSWLRSIKGYVELDRNFATRLWKRFYDRFLLKARPQERRIAQLILLIEGALLIAGLLTLTAFKLAKLII